MASSAPVITADELDDLIYYSRAGDLSSLQESINTLSQRYSTTQSATIHAAIDVDEEGLGSQASILHYPAANGNLEIIQYILSQIALEQEKDNTNAGTNGTTPHTNGTSARPGPTRDTFINHQNVSGNTALHWAGMNGHLSIVQALIKAGADPEIVNGAGRDAVVESEWSVKEGAAECAEWMLKECGWLEKGIGGVEGEEQGEAAGADEDEVMVASESRADGEQSTG